MFKQLKMFSHNTPWACIFSVFSLWFYLKIIKNSIQNFYPEQYRTRTERKQNDFFNELLMYDDKLMQRLNTYLISERRIQTNASFQPVDLDPKVVDEMGMVDGLEYPQLVRYIPVQMFSNIVGPLWCGALGFRMTPLFYIY